jgi:hypothetical protein
VTFEQFEDLKLNEMYIRMLYNGTPLNLAACSKPDKHHAKSKSLCTMQAFIDRAKKMSMDEFEYKNACFYDQNVQVDWD